LYEYVCHNLLAKLNVHHPTIVTLGLFTKSSVTVKVTVITSHAFANPVFALLVVTVDVPVNSGGVLSIRFTVAKFSHVFHASS